MPNHYTNIVIFYRGYTDDGGERGEELTIEAWQNPLYRLLPMPEELQGTADGQASARLGWKRIHWGTKWGAYNSKVTQLPGDGQPIQLTFATAWSAPNKQARAAIIKELEERFGADSIFWLGANPDDISFDIHTNTRPGKG